MNEKLIQRSKFLSRILRHDPDIIDIKLDSKGFAIVDDLIKNGSFSKLELREIVENDSKGRYEFNVDKTAIRCVQGHSFIVDVDLVITEPPEFLYHGTKEKYLSSIYKRGLLPMERQYVHLTANEKTAIDTASRRKGASKILTINSGEMHKNGLLFYLSKNSVWLVTEVHPKYIQGISVYKF